MPNPFFKASDDVHDNMREVLAANHPDLAIVCNEIGIIFREKHGNSGGQRVMGRAYKPSPATTAMYNGEFKFIIELPGDIWENELDTRGREAMLDHCLCMITAEEDKETAEPICRTRGYDVQGFKENIERFGMWFPKDPEAESETEGPEVDGIVEGG